MQTSVKLARQNTVQKNYKETDEEYSHGYLNEVMHPDEQTKHRSISLNAFAQKKVSVIENAARSCRNISADESSNIICSERTFQNTTLTMLLSKLRNFKLQVHRHMIESLVVSGDVSQALPRTAVGGLYFLPKDISTPKSKRRTKKQVNDKYRRRNSDPLLNLNVYGSEMKHKNSNVCNNNDSLTHLNMNRISPSTNENFVHKLSGCFKNPIEFISKKSSTITKPDSSIPRTKSDLIKLENIYRSAPQLVKKMSLEEQSDVCLEETDITEGFEGIDEKKQRRRSWRTSEHCSDDANSNCEIIWDKKDVDQDPIMLGQALEIYLGKLMEEKQNRSFLYGSHQMIHNSLHSKDNYVAQRAKIFPSENYTKT